MLKDFPKTRPPLPTEYTRIYCAHYKANRDAITVATRLSSRVERWLHAQVARDVLGLDQPLSTLEIGAGTLNQLRYEPALGPYDIVEPMQELYANSPYLSRIRNIFSDIGEVPAGLRYDRVTAVAALEHICDLPRVIARAGLLLTPGGVMRASVPSEGTLLWKAGWMLTTGIEFRLKWGLDYGPLMRYEHVNTAAEVEYVLRYFFQEVDCRVFGISRYFSLYQAFFCQTPDLAKCMTYCSGT